MKIESHLNCAPCHTKAAFDPATMPDIVTWAAEVARVTKVDAIMVCGHSGLAIGGAVSYLTRIPLIACRKKGDNPRADSRTVTAVLPNGTAERWLWLDDCISSGETLRYAVQQSMKYNLIVNQVPTAVALYDRHKFDTDENYNVGYYLNLDSHFVSSDNDLRYKVCPLYAMRPML